MSPALRSHLDLFHKLLSARVVASAFRCISGAPSPELVALVDGPLSGHQDVFLVHTETSQHTEFSIWQREVSCIMSLFTTASVVALGGLGIVVVLIAVAHVCGMGSRPKGYPPGPPTLPIIGNLHLMPKSQAHIRTYLTQTGRLRFWTGYQSPRADTFQNSRTGRKNMGESNEEHLSLI